MKNVLLVLFGFCLGVFYADYRVRSMEDEYRKKLRRIACEVMCEVVIECAATECYCGETLLEEV